MIRFGKCDVPAYAVCRLAGTLGRNRSKVAVSHASSVDAEPCWFDIEVVGPPWSVVGQPEDADRRICCSVVDRLSRLMSRQRVF
jgi:hypothetical protein